MAQCQNIVFQCQNSNRVHWKIWSWNKACLRQGPRADAVSNSSSPQSLEVDVCCWVNYPHFQFADAERESSRKVDKFPVANQCRALSQLKQQYSQEGFWRMLVNSLRPCILLKGRDPLKKGITLHFSTIYLSHKNQRKKPYLNLIKFIVLSWTIYYFTKCLFEFPNSWATGCLPLPTSELNTGRTA